MKKYTNADIKGFLDTYFMPAKELKKLGDFDRMVGVPAKMRLFEAVAPEIVRQLFKAKR